MENNISKISPDVITRKELDAATAKVAEELTQKAQVRASTERDPAKRQNILDLCKITIKTSLNFTELINRELFGQRPRMINPEEERQGRISHTLGVEDLERIHFHSLNWWFWSKWNESRIGPYDTAELAAEGLVSYEQHLKDIR